MNQLEDKENISNYFVKSEEKNMEFNFTDKNPSFIFRDETWEHINDFLVTKDNYLWNQFHNSDFKRFKIINNAINLCSPRKDNNWNCLFYRNASFADFSFEFNITIKNIFDEIQVSFNCKDLRNRCRFIIKNGNNVCFEIIENAIFYRNIQETYFKIEPNKSYLIKIVKISKNYQLFINNELLFSIDDKSNINLGRDLAIILYNRYDDNEINAIISNITLKQNEKYKTKVGILTYHRSINYGAFLQAYCLCKRLEKENNFECEIIDFRMIKEIETYGTLLEKYKDYKNIVTRNKAKCFYKNLLNSFDKNYEKRIVNMSSSCLESNEANDLIKFIDNKYDIVICGSDEIWRIDSFRGFPNPYWINGNIHSKKVAYAISSRSNLNKIDYKNKEFIKDTLNNFDILTFRDKITIDYFKTLNISKEMSRQPDPVFLYDIPLKKENILKRYVNNKKKNLVLCIDMIDDCKFVEKIKADLSDEFNIISLFRFHEKCINISSISPFEWVEIISEADFVITNLFHCVCFSIIKKIPYIALCIDDKKEKILSLQSKDIDLNKRCVFSVDDFLLLNLKIILKELNEVIDSNEYIIKCRNDFESFIKSLKKLIN